MTAPAPEPPLVAGTAELNRPMRCRRDAALDIAEAALREIAWSNSQDGKITAVAWKALHRIEELLR